MGHGTHWSLGDCLHRDILPEELSSYLGEWVGVMGKEGGRVIVYWELVEEGMCVSLDATVSNGLVHNSLQPPVIKDFLVSLSMPSFICMW